MSTVKILPGFLAVLAVGAILWWVRVQPELTLEKRIPGRDVFFEYGDLFIHVIQYNVRISFGGGVRRQTFRYFILNMCFSVFLKSLETTQISFCCEIHSD